MPWKLTALIIKNQGYKQEEIGTRKAKSVLNAFLKSPRRGKGPYEMMLNI